MLPTKQRPADEWLDPMSYYSVCKDDVLVLEHEGVIRFYVLYCMFICNMTYTEYIHIYMYVYISRHMLIVDNDVRFWSKHNNRFQTLTTL